LKPSEKIASLEKLAQIPSYHVLGALSQGRLVYHSNEGGAFSLWFIDLKSRKRERLTKEPLPLIGIAEPRQDASKVFFARDQSKGGELSKIFVVRADKPEKEYLLAEMEAVRVLGLASFDESTVGFAGGTSSNLSLYLAREGSSCEKVAELPGLAIVTDANEKYVVGSGFLRKTAISEELFFLEIATRKLTIFTPKESSVNKKPILNGSKVVFESNYEDGNNRLYVHDAASGSTFRPYFTGSDYAAYSPVENPYFGWLEPSPGRIWAVGKRDGEMRGFAEGKLIPTPPGSFNGASFVGNTMYFAHSTLVRPPRILAVDSIKGKTDLIIENSIPSEYEEKLGKANFQKIKSFDGQEVPCFVIESAGARKPGPVVLYIHGGPTAEVANVWSALIPSIVLSGYHVIAPNYRGSTGYGEEYKLKNVGDLGGGDLKDMIAAAQFSKESGLAERVAIFGYSYGGYATLLALGTHPDLFVCGVAGAPIADWVEKYELSDAAFRSILELHFGVKGGVVSNDLLRERSPSSYVERVKAPLCIIHSQNDTRTPLAPVLKYALKLPKDVSFEMHVKPDLGHAIASVDDVVNVVFPAVEFFSKHLPANHKVEGE
jgi:pimeloyl-ACP methyl ester carboxylesterase